MRKFLSMILVLVLVCMMCSVPAFAANVEITVGSAEIEQNAASGEAVIYISASSDTYDALWSATGDITFDEGLTFTKAEVVDSANQVTLSEISTNVVGFYDNSAAQEGFSIAGGKDILKLTFTVNDTSIAADYNISVVWTEVTDGACNDVTAEVTAVDGVIAVKGEDKPTVITIVDSDITAVADAAIDETSWQKGQGAMLKFNTADLAEFNQMNWVLNLVSGGKKFAKVDNFSVAGIDAPTVELFATFIVNEKANPEVAAYQFSSVDAGFKKADDNNVYATFAE